MTDATAKNMMVKSTLSFIGSSFLGFGLVNPSHGCVLECRPHLGPQTGRDWYVIMLQTESGGLPVESNRNPIIDSLLFSPGGFSFTTRTARPVYLRSPDVIDLLPRRQLPRNAQAPP